MRGTFIPSAPMLGAPPSETPRPRRVTQPAELVDQYGNPIEIPVRAPEVPHCLCGAPATTELLTCGRWECGRY